jgi:hypothetical protein
MNPAPFSKFGQGRYSKETEELYHQFQKIYGIPEPVAQLIACLVPTQAGQLTTNYFGRPTIRYLATREPITTYALALVKSCVNAEKSLEKGSITKLPIPLPLRLQQWVETIVAALALNDEGAVARKKAGVSLHACPDCKEWKLDGRISHAPNCPSETWRTVTENQRQLPPQRQREELNVNAAIVTAKKKAKLGPPLNAPAPKKSKPHPQSSWPPIVPGGAVESNRRKF